MKFIKMSREGNYRGQKYVPGTIIPVSESLFSNMILAGKGSPSTEELYKAQENDNADNGSGSDASTKPADIKKMNKDTLIAHAKSLGLEFDEELTKVKIIELIEAKK